MLLDSTLSKKTQTTDYFPALTGIRAVAALMVVLFHFNPLVHASQQNIIARWTNYFIQQLHIGVPIFFVLSGFLIAHRYMNSVELSVRWLRIYLWNRFTRIYPIYFLLTVITFLLLQYAPEANPGAWQLADFTWKDKTVTVLLNLTLLKAFFKTLLTSGIPTAWSLTVEENFYILAPFLFISLRWNKKYLFLYPLILLLAGSLLVFLGSLTPYFLYGFMKSMNFMLRFTFFGRCIEFLCGVGLASYVLQNSHRSSKKPVFTTFGLAGIIFCAVVLAIIKVNYTPTDLWPTSAWSIVVQNFVLPFFVTSLLYGLVREYSSAKQLLETKTCSILGKSSYVLYLIHIGPIDNFFSYYISVNPLIRAGTYYFLSILIFLFIEEPLRMKLRSNNYSRH